MHIVIDRRFRGRNQCLHKLPCNNQMLWAPNSHKKTKLFTVRLISCEIKCRCTEISVKKTDNLFAKINILHEVVIAKIW